MEIKELLDLIFKDYWSQILLLCGIVGYFFKLKSERKSKLIEIKTTVFYEKKFEQIEKVNFLIIDFIKPVEYLLHLMTNGCPLPSALKITTDKISNTHFELIKELDTLKLYSSSSSKKNIDDYVSYIKEMYNINITIKVRYEEKTEIINQEIVLNQTLQEKLNLFKEAVNGFFVTSYKDYS